MSAVMIQKLQDRLKKMEERIQALETKSGLQTLSGLPVDESLSLKFKSGAKLDIDHLGTVAISDAGGATLRLDTNSGEVVLQDIHGNSFKMSATGVSVKGEQVVVEGGQIMLAGKDGEPVIKGQSFLSLFMTHVHSTGSQGGPTSPPIPQDETSTLSTKVSAS